MRIDRQIHPFVLADGRRFATLYCAAHSVLQARSVADMKKLIPVTNERNGEQFSMDALRGEKNPLVKETPVVNIQ